MAEILLVERDRRIIDQLRTTADRLDHGLHVFAHPDLAWRAARMVAFDLIICDITIFHNDDDRLVRRFLQDSMFCKVPIMVTVGAGASTEALELINIYDNLTVLSKPSDPATLRDAVSYALLWKDVMRLPDLRTEARILDILDGATVELEPELSPRRSRKRPPVRTERLRRCAQ